jgi:hypothetical protein
MKKVILIIVVLLVLCLLVCICGSAALLKFRSPGSGEKEYVNSAFNFSLVIPSGWTDTSDATSVTITPDKGKGRLDFQVFERDEFKQLTRIDQPFCDDFSTGFQEGLNVDKKVAAQFSFKLFDLNGSRGCRAEGSVVDGVFQRDYVFFDNSNKKMYNIYYTETGGDEKAPLEKALDTFIVEDNLSIKFRVGSTLVYYGTP